MSDIHLEVSVDDQQLLVLRGDQVLKRYPISTAAKGVGNQKGSNRTPTGQFAICEKIGGDSPAGTIFKSRRPEGYWDGRHHPEDLVLSRILWLEGLDADNRNTRERFIYIHGTNHESFLGTACSQGCLRMSNADVIDLYDRVETGTRMIIHPPTRTGGNLIFFDCDSTLSSIEGIDELARARGPEVFRQVEDLTNAAMNGEIPIEEVFPRRMEIIRPDRDLCEKVARRYLETITEGTPELVSELKTKGWTPVILSGGFAPLIEPLARQLGISHVEAVPLELDPEGAYLGYDADYPTTRNGGKPEIIFQWKEALRPGRIVMIGDGVSDLETKPAVDLFVGYGGVAARPAVREGADAWIERMADFPGVCHW